MNMSAAILVVITNIIWIVFSLYMHTSWMDFYEASYDEWMDVIEALEDEVVSLYLSDPGEEGEAHED